MTSRLRRSLSALPSAGARVRVLFDRGVGFLGMGESTFLVPLAVVVGVVTAAAAVGFHELILLIRNSLYVRPGERFLYGYGLWMLVAVPAGGGLLVGIISRKVAQEKEGHGVVDVMESVARTRGFVKPATAVEKILTSAITIGTGGSAGAEGPIVQIGAAVSSGVASLFRLARHQMPTLIGCGCAAGISAIFNAPIGGLLFTLEVILLDFSIRTLTPIIVASVIANVTMRALVLAIEHLLHRGGESSYITVFANPTIDFGNNSILDWSQMGNFVILGLFCGVIGVALTRGMDAGEHVFRKAMSGRQWVKTLRPMVGGILLGLLALAAVLVAREAVGAGGHHGAAFGFNDYPQPAFYGDGYGVIEVLLGPSFYAPGRFDPWPLMALLAGLTAMKFLATIFTLSSGGSGGVIAPSLFLGASTGGFVGVALRQTGLFGDHVRPEAYALIGMAALLAAVVHAPLASILILFEITHQDEVLLPAMLGVVVALGTARLLMHDSLYTSALRRRGVSLSSGDPTLLSRLTVEQVSLDPANALRPGDPLQKVVDLLDTSGTHDFVVADEDGKYRGFIGGDDLNLALIGREAVPLMVVAELMRTDIPLALNTDDLGRVFDLFARYDVAHLPVGLAGEAGGGGGGGAKEGKVIGMISRASLMRRYRRELDK